MTASFEARPSATRIAKNAWTSVRDAALAMKPLFASAVVAGAVLSVAIFSIPALTRSAVLSARAEFAPSAVVVHLAVQISIALAWALLQAPVAVAIHRFILLGEVTPGILLYAPRHTRLFFYWLLAIRLFLLAFGTAALLLLPHALGFVILFAAAAIFGCLIASIYLTMIFPAVAIDMPCESRSARIEKSMEQVSGNFWLLIWAGIMAFLPLFILGVILQAVFFRQRIAGTGLSSTQSPFVFVGSALYGCFEILGIALGAAIVSWLYAWVRNNKPG